MGITYEIEIIVGNLKKDMFDSVRCTLEDLGVEGISPISSLFENEGLYERANYNAPFHEGRYYGTFTIYGVRTPEDIHKKLQEGLPEYKVATRWKPWVPWKLRFGEEA